MSLVDVMSGAGLAIYAEVSIVIFLVVFVAIVVRTYRPSRRAEFEETGRLPLDDETADSPASGGQR